MCLARTLTPKPSTLDPGHYTLNPCRIPREVLEEEVDEHLCAHRSITRCRTNMATWLIGTVPSSLDSGKNTFETQGLDPDHDPSPKSAPPSALTAGPRSCVPLSSKHGK